MTLDRDEICREISGELEDTARWLSGGDLSPDQFRRMVCRLEQRKLERFGIKLSSSVSGNGLVHFTLRFADTGEPCASLDINSRTGSMVMQMTY